jgi:hypothetical protein
MDQGASFIVADILADREARVPTFGLDNALSPRFWAAVKTGTSKDMRDNWCVGFSRRYTVGVWVGNASGEPMWDVSGVSGAAPVWRSVMDELHRKEASTPGWRAPAMPPRSLVQRPVRFENSIEPPRDEWFVVGTEQSTVRLAASRGSARSLIASPADRMLIALDPDIPPLAQKLQLTPAAGTSPDWGWRMDGKKLGPAKNMSWTMWPGPHRLDLVDTAGNLVESASFEVRGAQVKKMTAQFSTQ